MLVLSVKDVCNINVASDAVREPHVAAQPCAGWHGHKVGQQQNMQMVKKLGQSLKVGLL